jgi:small nuclear ribonucleoprotein
MNVPDNAVAVGNAGSVLGHVCHRDRHGDETVRLVGSGRFKHATDGDENMSGRPLDVLEASLEEEVTVLLKGGEQFVGTLAGYDQHMNLVLEEVGETQDTTIIRGDNVVTIDT